MGTNSYLHVFKSGIHRCDLHAYGLGAACSSLRDTLPTAMPPGVDWSDGNRGGVYFFHPSIVLLAITFDAQPGSASAQR